MRWWLSSVKSKPYPHDHSTHPRPYSVPAERTVNANLSCSGSAFASDLTILQKPFFSDEIGVKDKRSPVFLPRTTAPHGEACSHAKLSPCQPSVNVKSIFLREDAVGRSVICGERSFKSFINLLARGRIFFQLRRTGKTVGIYVEPIR